MAVENVVFVAGVIIGQGPNQGLPGHFARLSGPHQLLTYMFFSLEELMMDHITCFGAAESLIMDHITCWRVPKEDGRPAERQRRPQRQQLRRGNYRHFFELGFRGQQLKEVIQNSPKCGGV